MQTVFNQGDRDQIASMPLSMFKRSDRFFWKFAKSGTYKVKSGYVKAVQASKIIKRSQKLEGETSWEMRKHAIWKQLWNLNLKYKIKHFIWKCLQKGVAVKKAIYKRTGRGDMICPVCGDEVETSKHMLLTCTRAQCVWKLAAVR